MAKKPVYIEIYENIRNSIITGIRKDGDFLPTEKELQEEFYVSRITVRKAMELLVNDGLIKKIAGYGTFVDRKFTPGASASLLTIGVVLCNFSDTFGTQLLTAIEEHARKNGYSIVFKNSRDSFETEKEILNELLGLSVKGIIIQPTHNQFYNEKLIQLHINGFPLVLVDRHLSGFSIPSVSTNNYDAAEKAVQYLFSHGHEKISFFSADPQHTSTLYDRLNGFKSAFLINSKLITPENLLCDFLTPIGAYPDAETMESDILRIMRYLSENPRITAILTAETSIARLVLQALKRLKKTVPHDYSIVTFDYGADDSDLKPTHIKQNQNAMGKVAVDLLIKCIAKETVSDKILVPYTLVEGNSVK